MERGEIVSPQAPAGKKGCGPIKHRLASATTAPTFIDVQDAWQTGRLLEKSL
jgi:hypothetical protein